MNKKILIVDNNKVILRLLSALLERLGYKVRTAEDGLQALDILETFHPAFIFVDLIMPKMDGKRLCRLIRKMPEFEGTYLIIISAIAAEEKIDFLSFGADACIAKGSMTTMKKHIRDVLTNLEQRNLEKVGSKIYGTENVFEREITKELLAANRHFEITLDTIADGFLELSADGRILFSNKRAAVLLNRKEDELLSQPFIDFFPDDSQKEIEEVLSNLGHAPVEIGEKTTLRLNGSYLLIKFVRLLEMEQKYTLVLLQDITRRKEMEQQILQHQQDLEKKIAERTADYEKANKELTKALSEVKRLSGLIPICASCKKIRDDKGYWSQIESYISAHSEAQFSHSLCPACAKALYPDFIHPPKE